jgi:type IV pilus assembly protein PilC
MPKFKFTATKDGKTISGVVEASSRDSLLASLARQGVHPLLIKEEGARSGGLTSKFKRQKKVKMKELVMFTRQLSVMVSAGVPLSRALSTLQAQRASKYLKSVVGGVT